MVKKYERHSEAELKTMYLTESITDAVTEHLNTGWDLVGVSYVGGCRATGQHVYHFVKETK